MIGLVFLDLDDTILQTRRKKDRSDLEPAALDQDGNPVSFMTPAQVFLVNNLSKNFDLIPVTARNRESFGRVKISFRKGAILNFGGTILTPLWEIDKKYLNIITPMAKEAKGLLEETLRNGNKLCKQEKFKARLRIIGEDDLSFYLVAKTEPDRLSELSALKDELSKLVPADEGSFYLNDNNLSFLPSYLDKSFAVDYFIKTYILRQFIVRDDLVILGIGDSNSDRGFLCLCDYVIIPTGSQLGNSLL
jgi:hydroxymethylpyrimidine pyrophosphatase-like HAD family hydrolase